MTAVCEPGTRACLDETNPQACNADGQWEPAATCPAESPVCHQGDCLVCDPGAARCNGNSPELCAADGGSWITGDECSGETPACIAATASCGRCTEGERQCNGTTPQSCNAEGEWTDLSPCGGAFPSCLLGECVECDPAQGNGRRCYDESTPQVCTLDGSYQDETTCDGATPVCRPETGRCACVDDTTRCVANSAQRCVNGAWVTQETCSGDTPVCLGSGTCGCTNGAVRCSGAIPQRCENNAWVSQPECAGEAPVCSAGACVCREGEQRCSGGATRQRCTNGSFQPISSCSGANPVCSGDGVCGCEAGATRCESPRIVASCQADHTWSNTTCADNFACNGQTCTTGPAAPGYVACGPSLVCDVGEQCCYDATTSTGQCQGQAPIGSTCARREAEFEFDCDGPNDCGNGKVCCSVAYMRSVSFCAAPGECTGQGAAVMCNASLGAQNNPACAAGKTCTIWSGALSYMATCR